MRGTTISREKKECTVCLRGRRTIVPYSCLDRLREADDAYSSRAEESSYLWRYLSTVQNLLPEF
jgi:hypothetical protein